MQRICGPFILEFIREILSTSVFFGRSIYIETAQNSREECNEFADLLFWRLSLMAAATLGDLTELFPIN